MRNSKVYIIISAILVAIIIAYTSTSYFFYKLNTDFKRTFSIVKALTTNHSPQAVMLGNSILMSGIKTKLLSNDTAPKLIYNLGTSGQTLKESILFYSKVPSSVKEVYQFIQVGQLEHQLAPIPENVLRNLVMAGYQFEKDADTLLPLSEVNYFTKNKFLIQFEARTVFLNSFNHTFRKLMRKDLLIDSNIENLFYPFLYTQKLEPITYQKIITKYNPISPKHSFHIDSNTVTYLSKANVYFKNKGIRYIVVLYPTNPDLFNITPQYKKDAAQQLSQFINLTVIDCQNILTSNDFVDQFHMNTNGAVKFSNYLKTQIDAF